MTIIKTRLKNVPARQLYSHAQQFYEDVNRGDTMRAQIIKNRTVPVVDFETLRAQQLLWDKTYTKLSVTKIQLQGKQQTGINMKCDAVYYILTGKGSFYLNGVKKQVNRGDLVFIPKGTPYKDEGKLTLLAINTPQFDKKQRVEMK